jgi:hypothetical protein
MGEKILSPCCSVEIERPKADQSGPWILCECPECHAPFVLLRSVSYRLFRVEEVNHDNRS